jgi:chaperonin GroES
MPSTVEVMSSVEPSPAITPAPVIPVPAIPAVKSPVNLVVGITMLADRVLVHIPNPDGERKSKGGLLIPATAQVSRRLAWAEVVAIGPGVRLIQLGDKVLFNPEDRYEVEVGGEDYLLLRERDIHGVAADRSDGATGLYL